MTPKSKEEGTIIFFFGGYKEEPKHNDKIVVGTKGWSDIFNNPLTTPECQTIKDLIELGWKIIVLDYMQFVTPDNTLHNEMWLEEYVKWIEEIFPEEQNQSKKKFMVGFSSGAYIVGLHLIHLAEKKEKKPSIAGYGIFSYPVDLDQPNKKTNFESTHFEDKSILFLSGSKNEDKKGKPPDVDGYLNTRKLYENGCKSNNAQLGWESLNTGHRIFEAKDFEGRSCVAKIMNSWFKSYPDFKLPESIGASKENNIKNLNGHNVKI